jgi:transcriptional regulator of acetoin/glycerol metabolism
MVSLTPGGAANWPNIVRLQETTDTMAKHATASAPPAPRPHRRTEHAARPIAASLALGPTHNGVIEQSQLRCSVLGLSRIARPDYAPLGRPDLVVVRERNRRLHTHAAPVMEMLAEQIVGTQSMVVLCDSTGTIIHSIGDDDFLSRASKVALQPGVNWSEPSKGTNAIGTALIEEAPTLVHADEHYMHANHFLTCSAAPILDPRGHILGVLDVTGDHRSYHQHTMALVKMSARMIENHWLSDDHRNAVRLHFHQRPEFIDTLMEGILAVSSEGRIVGANRSALEQLGLSGAALRMQHLGSLFGTSVGALVDRFRSPLATPMAVQSALGRALHIHARFNWSAWGSVPALPVEPRAAAAPARKTPAHTPPAQAALGLAQLLTGDAQMAVLVDRLRLVLDHEVPIVIVGDTGTGKDVLARALHQDSARAHQPFVVLRCAVLRCAGLPAGPSEAELFGASGLLGRILQARHGTLFLDEVGQLPAALQLRLLHTLQEGQLTPPGHDAAQPLGLALVCASTEPLHRTGLRQDLQDRLNHLTVTLPPLRERSDLPALARRLLDGLNHDKPPQLSGQALALLQAHPWPGNLRELHNLLRTAALLAGPGGLISPEHLPDALRAAAAPGPTDASAGQSLQALELMALRAAVDAAGGNIALAARRLGVGRNTIYRKLRWGPAALGG